MKLNRKHYFFFGRVDTLYDESGLVCYQYGNMGEITRETRIYTVPFLSNIIALSTQFEYDSWGRILNITYPDNEIVSYEYDCGGQLFRFYNNQNYTYLDSVQNNKFGAKISQKYGNGIQTKYTYYPLTQRLDSLLTTYSGNTLSYLQYTYDSVGNIIRVNSSYPMPQYVVTERYSYDSADQLLTAESTCNNNVLCSGAYSYNNWGKINTYTQQTTDPATNISENKDYRYYFPSNSSDMAQGQTSFAPIIKYDMQQNPQPLETCTYGINGSIRKRVDNQTQNTDYYYFNTSGNLKACGTDMQISVYGYNATNTRTYKVNLFNANQWVNGHPQPIQPMVQSAMFYPNTYINFTQAGEYTKHYYNGTERIASRLGEQQVPVSVENDQELLNYQHDTKEILRNAIGQHLYDEPTDMQEGEVLHLEYLQPCGNNNAVYYYHPNHLSSSMYVTDMQQSVVQSFLYAPYGEIISEYNTHAMGEAFPKYSFNAKELDEETGMYYYEARYYAPPTFTSRDPLFEKYFWMSPYAYCANNPVKYVDPSGREPIDPRTGKQVKIKFNNAAVYDYNNNNRHVRDENLYSRATPLIPRQRGKPDGVWSGAAYFPHSSVWESISAGAQKALGKLFPNNGNVSADYGSPNDGAWRRAALLGSYSYVDDKYAVSEVFHIGKKSFNIMTVDENYITQIVNLDRPSRDGKFNINSVISFDIEKGDIQIRTVKTWWGGSRTEKYRILNVIETIQQYKNNQAIGEKQVRKYITEEVIK